MKFFVKNVLFGNDKIVLDIMKQQMYLLLYTRKEVNNLSVSYENNWIISLL